MTNQPRGLADLERIDAVFAALAHPNRRQIMTVLRARGGTMTSGELASRFDCSWPTTTGHLTVLAEANLVRIEKRGRQRHYTLNGAELDAVAGEWINKFRPKERATSAR